MVRNLGNKFLWSTLTTLDRGTDDKTFKPKVKPHASSKWSHFKVFNSLSSLPIKFQNCIDHGKLSSIVFYNNIAISGEIAWKIAREKQRKKIAVSLHHIHSLFTLTDHGSRATSARKIALQREFRVGFIVSTNKSGSII